MVVGETQHFGKPPNGVKLKPLKTMDLKLSNQNWRPSFLPTKKLLTSVRPIHLYDCCSDSLSTESNLCIKVPKTEIHGTHLAANNLFWFQLSHSHLASFGSCSWGRLCRFADHHGIPLTPKPPAVWGTFVPHVGRKLCCWTRGEMEGDRSGDWESGHWQHFLEKNPPWISILTRPWRMELHRLCMQRQKFLKNKRRSMHFSDALVLIDTSNMVDLIWFDTKALLVTPLPFSNSHLVSGQIIQWRFDQS